MFLVVREFYHWASEEVGAEAREESGGFGGQVLWRSRLNDVGVVALYGREGD